MTKRTGHRQPRKPTPPPQPEASKVDLAADQLVVLWDRMQHATARDSAGLTGGDGRSAGGNVHAAVVNVDVVETMVRIRSELGDVVAQVEPILSLDRQRRTVTETVGKLGAWHRSLEARKQQPLARDIEHDVRKWEGLARRALGLDTHGRDFGELCPFHRGDEPTPLLVDPDRATLHESLLIGRQPVARDDGGRVVRDATGEPRRLPPMQWKYSDRISCPHCKRSWSGLQELRVLGNLLGAAPRTDLPRGRPVDVSRVPDGATQDGWRYEAARQWWLDPETSSVVFMGSPAGRYLLERWQAAGGPASHVVLVESAPAHVPDRRRAPAYGGRLQIVSSSPDHRSVGPRRHVMGRAGRCDRCDMVLGSCSCPAGPVTS